MGIRNQNTIHADKSARRQRALDRLPALLPMPAAPVIDTKPPRPVKRGKGKMVATIEDVLPTQHERDIAEAAQANHVRAVARAEAHNARVTAERAVLESRIGRPPRQWPKKQIVVHEECPHGGSRTPYEDNPEADWDAYMSIPK